MVCLARRMSVSKAASTVVYPSHHMPSQPPHQHSPPPLAGTRTGITAAQLDVKLPGGVPLEIVEEGVRAAARGRAQLLSIMEQALPKVGGAGGWELSRAGRWESSLARLTGMPLRTLT